MTCHAYLIVISVQRGPIALPSMNNDLTYSLDVFSDEEFTEPLSFSSDMPANSILYVQTTVTGGMVDLQK